MAAGRNDKDPSLQEARMSAEYRSKSVQIASKGIAENGVSGRRFATLLTGGALVLALVLGAAMPAKADKKDDLAKALVAALAIGIIANELNDKPKPVKVKQKRVPSTCAISIDGALRSVTLYSEACLRREGFDRRLPRGCANDARIFGQDDRVYSEQCLRDAGFRISGR
ncbi:MAG: hypothetical protein C0524_15685 [Rhodobacter sp.]|nr:hypothetical protein [Rhodobacter sp.]